MFAALGEVDTWIEARESLEIADEMRLIEIAASERDIGPIHLLRPMDELQHLLKAPDAAEELWRQPDLFVKNLDKASRAEAKLSGHVRDSARVRHAMKLSQSKIHRWVARQVP